MIVIVNYLENVDVPAGIRLQIKILSCLILSCQYPSPKPPPERKETCVVHDNIEQLWQALHRCNI